MDESSVKLDQSWPRGCVAMAAAGECAPPLERPVSLRHRRAAVSLVCFVCDDAAVQPLLPQVIVGNERVLPASVAARLQDAGTGNVVVLRRQSSWVNGETLRRIIAMLAAALAPLRERRHIILSMDACPTHLMPSVIRAVARGGMSYLLIAAQMTKWLQPLDVGVFAPLKRRLRESYGEEQVRSGVAELPTETVMRLTMAGVEDVVQKGSWAVVFERCGLRGGRPTSARFLRALGPLALRPLTAELPTFPQLRALFPRGHDIPVGALFDHLVTGERPRRAPRLKGPGAAPGTAEPTAAHPAGVWIGRTRSTSRLGDSAGSAAIPDSEAPSPPSLPAPPPARSRLPYGTRLAWPPRMPAPAASPPPPAPS